MAARDGVFVGEGAFLVLRRFEGPLGLGSSTGIYYTRLWPAGLSEPD